MTLRLHNNLTRQLEPFTPLDPACPTLYVCGPTVYNYVHIGSTCTAIRCVKHPWKAWKRRSKAC